MANQAGGFFYHWIAFRFRKNLWKPYIEQVVSWLNAWKPPVRRLIIVGPSAGYSLPTEWLNRFESLVLIDPDPRARKKFSKIHPGLKTKPDWIIHSLFEDSDLGSWKTTIRGNTPTAILFSNFLGQLKYAEIKLPVKDFIDAIPAGTQWASYHDRYSYYGKDTIDHETGDFPRSKKMGETKWEITPGVIHQIDWVIGN
ncbi:MAG: hypothetical protein KA715_06720 [Xanthomonadaceae bacterium]|nr:hypothetical protein [Xanthomonadaceae bacterium]